MKRGITLDTKFVGLFGHPLRQSFSPELHNTNFELQKYDGIYVPFEVDRDGLEGAMDGIRSMGFIGCNVTKPNKIEVLKYLDEIDDVAKEIGSVNTIKVVDGRLRGYNTDGMGFVESLEKEEKIMISEHSFLVQGCGGAGRAVAFNLARRGAKKLVLLDTSEDNLRSLLGDMKDRGYTMVEAAGGNELAEALKKVDLYINATGIGMYPRLDAMPCRSEDLHKELVVCDLTYNPLKTKLLVEAEKKGCRIVNGLGMVTYQGALAYEIWTGRSAPVENMKKIMKRIVEAS